ncbi:hypothetical protein HBI64_155460 [Parastagonospora nodorum]|nr:hypothetical protein HBH47_218140 [Parastagonospora nodorum]KAH5014133.1 hypothetical protein HBI74_184380 [Parastagonospora nodorum]KAH6122804.1 hypothetical protein HBI64_155460 [Parastagonospora nodorum]
MDQASCYCVRTTQCGEAARLRLGLQRIGDYPRLYSPPRSTFRQTHHQAWLPASTLKSFGVQLTDAVGNDAVASNSKFGQGRRISRAVLLTAWSIQDTSPYIKPDMAAASAHFHIT